MAKRGRGGKKGGAGKGGSRGKSSGSSGGSKGGSKGGSTGGSKGGSGGGRGLLQISCAVSPFSWLGAVGTYLGHVPRGPLLAR